LRKINSNLKEKYIKETTEKFEKMYTIINKLKSGKLQPSEAMEFIGNSEFEKQKNNSPN